jgi:hypothetical protein
MKWTNKGQTRKHACLCFYLSDFPIYVAFSFDQTNIGDRKYISTQYTPIQMRGLEDFTELENYAGTTLKAELMSGASDFYAA